MLRDLKINSELSYSSDNWNYEENFASIKDSNDSIIYTSYNELSSDFNKEDFFSIVETDIKKLKLFIIKENLVDSGELRGLNNIDLLDIISNYLDISCLDLEEIEALYNKYDLEYTKNYDVTYSRGYSQGDYVQILINKKEFFEKFEYNFIEQEDSFKTMFDNYLWDNEIYGTIDISFLHLDKRYNFEIEYNEFCNNTFKIDLEVNNIINYINNNIHIKLSSYDANLIIKKLEKLDYTDIKY